MSTMEKWAPIRKQGIEVVDIWSPFGFSQQSVFIISVKISYLPLLENILLILKNKIRIGKHWKADIKSIKGGNFYTSDFLNMVYEKLPRNI